MASMHRSKKEKKTQDGHVAKVTKKLLKNIQNELCITPNGHDIKAYYLT